MTRGILSRRDLNRALLARQLLLERQSLPVMDAVTQLVALQSQIPNPPYIGLWTRLTDFQRDNLTRLMDERQIIRAAFLRSTLHLVTRDDHQRFQAVLQPALEKGYRSFHARKAKGLDIDNLVEHARPFLEDDSRSMGDLRGHLLEIEPDIDGDALAYAIRTYLPLVQVPPSGQWGTGSKATYTTAESWFGAAQPADLRALFERYLAAFGPASVMDFQTWTGITKLKDTVEAWRDDFVLYEDENGKELFDLPDALRPAPDTPAPVRFIPEYDNLLVAHADRTRVIADDDRGYVFLSAARVLGTVLVDGFVAATWKVAVRKKRATLDVSLFRDVSPDDRAQIEREAEALVRWIADEADEHIVTLDVV